MNKNNCKHKIIWILLSTFILLNVMFFCVSCNSDKTNYADLIDTESEYIEQKLSSEQMLIYDNCLIKNYYTSNNRSVFRVVCSRGYVSDVTMLILLEDTIVIDLMGYDNNETENYGAKCFNERFLSQFKGMDLSVYNPIIAKPNDYMLQDGEIICVTHATITSNAVLSCVNAVAAFVNMDKK